MSFWEGKRVLVTGGTGFLGSWVLEQLAQIGGLVVWGSSGYDLRYREDIFRMLGETNPDLVIHLAAVVGGIGANQREPGRFFYDNAIMGIQLLEQARLHDVAKVILVGTTCSYPAHTPVPFREEDLWNGYPEPTNAPYGMAKKMLLVQAQAYWEQYGLNSIYLIPANLYGPRDNFDPETSHVIPALIRKCIEARNRGKETITLWGSGRPTRDFLYVEDAARGILLAAEHYDKPEPVNLGSGEEISISNLSAMIAQLTAFDGEIIWDSGKLDGQQKRRLDTSRAQREFGFEARVRLYDGLERTVQWVEGNLPWAQ